MAADRTGLLLEVVVMAVETLRANKLRSALTVLGIVIALVATFAVWFLLYRTSWGLKLRLVGHNPKFAEYAGIRSSFIMVSAMTVKGTKTKKAEMTTLQIVMAFSHIVDIVKILNWISFY